MPNPHETQPAYLETLKGPVELAVPVFELPVIVLGDLQKEGLDLGLQKSRHQLDALISRAVDQELESNPHADDLRVPAVKAEIYNAIGLKREDRLIDPDRVLGSLLEIGSGSLANRVLIDREGDNCAEARAILRDNVGEQLNHRGMAASRSAVRILIELAQGKDVTRQEWGSREELDAATRERQDRLQRLERVFNSYGEKCEMAVVEYQQQLITEKETERQIPIVNALEKGKKGFTQKQVEKLLQAEEEKVNWQERVIAALTNLVNRQTKSYTPAEVGQALGLIFVSCSSEEQPAIEQAIVKLFGEANIAYNPRSGLASGDVMLIDLMSEKEALIAGDHPIEFPVAEGILRGRASNLLKNQGLRLPSGWLHNLGTYPSGLLYPARLVERAVGNIIDRIGRVDISFGEADMVEKIASVEGIFTTAAKVKEILTGAFSSSLLIDGNKLANYLGKIDSAITARRGQVELKKRAIENTQTVAQTVEDLFGKWL